MKQLHQLDRINEKLYYDFLKFCDNRGVKVLNHRNDDAFLILIRANHLHESDNENIPALSYKYGGHYSKKLIKRAIKVCYKDFINDLKKHLREFPKETIILLRKDPTIEIDALFEFQGRYLVRLFCRIFWLKTK